MRIPGRDIGRKENLGNRYKIMIRTWTASIVPLYEEDFYRLCYGQVPSFRREKADRMKGKQVRAQSVGVWLLYERMKKEYGIEADTAYNLSHSGDYVLCSVSTERHAKVGCDIEEVKEPNLKMNRLPGKKIKRCSRSIFSVTGCSRRVLQKPPGKGWRWGWIPLRSCWETRRSL